MATFHTTQIRPVFRGVRTHPPTLGIVKKSPLLSRHFLGMTANLNGHVVITLCTHAQQGLCIQLHPFVYIYVYIYIYMSTKNRVFSALPLENLLLSVICYLLFKFKRLQCGLLRPASCTDRAIHAFPNKT